MFLQKKKKKSHQIWDNEAHSVKNALKKYIHQINDCNAKWQNDKCKAIISNLKYSLKNVFVHFN